MLFKQVNKGVAVSAITLIILGAAAAHNVVVTSNRLPSLVSPKIGIFYYVWYDPSSEVSWDQKKIVDIPLLGRYNSCDLTVISQHLCWIQELKVDFIIVSWWGLDANGSFCDNAIKQVFETAKNINSSLKIAIMVEPFNKSSFYNYSEIYEHIYSNFVAPYSSLYYSDNKPVICFFNDVCLTDKGVVPLDARFRTIIVGQQFYAQWTYTDLNKYDFPAHDLHGQISVTPRYDDSNVPDRTKPVIVDINLTQGVYDRQWERAIQLWREGKISTITITSWNEFPERTAIEPHYDKTAYNKDPYYLYNKTKSYISQVKP